jgi:DNA-binding PadR family transcriptional regulator
MLDDRGLIQSSESEGKRVYQITEPGRSFLAEGQAAEAAGNEGRPGPGRRRHWGRDHEHDWSEMAAFWQELRTLGPLFGRALHAARQDPIKQQRLRTLVEQVRRELTAIVEGPNSRIV